MTTTFENNLIDAVTAIVMAPVQALIGLLWLAWQGCKAIWPYRKYIGAAAAFVAFLGCCWALPALPLGLAITIAFGLATMPRKAVRA